MAMTAFMLGSLILVFQFLFTVIVIFVLRIYWVLSRRGTRRPMRRSPVKIMTVAGSGGHTMELLQLLSGLSEMYQPRIYVLAQTDHMSRDKIIDFEQKKNKDQISTSNFQLLTIPRSREVRQSWLSTIFSTFYASVYSFPLVIQTMPDVVLCNGPGTCIPVMLSAFLLKVLALKNCTLVYVESICRVETLSLSGKIAYYIADHFLVQWPQLKEKYPRSVYQGRLV